MAPDNIQVYVYSTSAPTKTTPSCILSILHLQMWLSHGRADDCVEGMLRFGNVNESSVLPGDQVYFCILGYVGWNEK